MRKIELLAPAGNFQALQGAINAGADAIYLGGRQYGARAYADNFSGDEICQGIHLAHLFGKKIYLTVNTLVKEKELDQLYGFILPFYEVGLDGVIVQDLGALRLIRESFPGLELHASTQMSLTGPFGVRMLQREGISRIVPARELSLEEIKIIKDSTGVEIESFIHGAMCYCYSGQCLFSSILGGRSGNRGRCAQPCRLPYQAGDGREQYFLSMKDMSTLDILPELIDAGIDSFKIEGRMKRPEYAAGVTAMYRKYIDLYLNNPKRYWVHPKDRKWLGSLYIRSSVGEGYYHRRNGKEMLALGSPAYLETDADMLKSIEEKYISPKLTIPVKATITLEVDCNAKLTLECGQNSVSVEGDVVQKALKRPLADEQIVSQIKKSGRSPIDITQVEVERTSAVFMPVSALNELRRLAISEMEIELMKSNGLFYEDRQEIRPCKADITKKTKKDSKWRLHTTVLTEHQLMAALQMQIERIYVDYRLLMEEKSAEIEELIKKEKRKGQEFFIASPYVSRTNAQECLAKIKQAVKSRVFKGVLIRNLESFGYFEDCLSPKQIVLDAGIYMWNRESIRFFEGRASEFYLPIECNAGEWKGLLSAENGQMEHSVLVYGRLPMMITAGCVCKTEDKCRRVSGITELKDRFETIFPVYHDCISCYNVIYNSVPLSLHGVFRDTMKPMCCRMDFTTESREEAVDIMSFFKELVSGANIKPAYTQYTTGHYKRGVE